ncbi:Fibronectin type III domain-containing protein [Pricia antarctica]|uniref:Fibronectin type III domain-containing protein n=1 Tax=Pricia antarctica TaxID=641691 RepID=A0A1G7EW30_9FLAO|nr:fibronectin type III domain-containing protein [Pricia antarctica]SDE67635.1 Fibronectin type III domain-containing protein [Pricia antarctica]
MKSVPLLLLAMCLISTQMGAQNAHTHANAASIENEANSVTGWSGGAVISSDASESQHGSFSIRAVSTASNGRTLTYTYNAQIGVQYTIRIWAKEGPQVSNPAAPAFAVWSGMTGFTTTLIRGTDWAEYVFNVTATSTSPLIRIYTSNAATSSTAGNTIFIDNVSILRVNSDSAPPSAVTTLAATGTTATGTQLSWSASTDNIGVTGYQVFRNGTQIGTPVGTAYTVTGLTQSTSYAFTVRAVDAAGNVSAAGNTVNVTTTQGTDSAPPSAVTTLTATGTTATGTQLSWSASTDNIGVTGYQVFRNGTQIGTPVGTAYTVTGLTQSTSYAFTVRAVDAAGNVSAAGNTVNVTTQGSGGIVDYTSQNANLASVDWQARNVFAAQTLGIGTTDTQGYALAVAGNVLAESVKIALQTNWPDYVFDKDYSLYSLEEVERFIIEKGYLPGLPSADEVKDNGIDVGEMNALLLKKIEEITLYVIQQDKKIKELEKKGKRLEFFHVTPEQRKRNKSTY